MLPSYCCKYPTKYKPVTHVIFDLDGTILDTEEVYADALTEILTKYEKKFTPELRQKVAGTRETDAAEIIVKEMELSVTPEEFAKQYRDTSNKKIGDCALMAGAEKLIKHLQSNKIPIAVATSSTQESFDLKTKKYKELFDLFHHIVCGGSDPEVKEGKPKPDIFQICAARFEEKPESSKCLVIEDAPNGIAAALAAGMQVVMTPHTDVPYEIWKTATLRLDSLEMMAPGFFGLPPFELPPDPEGFAGFKESILTFKTFMSVPSAAPTEDASKAPEDASKAPEDSQAK